MHKVHVHADGVTKTEYESLQGSPLAKARNSAKAQPCVCLALSSGGPKSVFCSLQGRARLLSDPEEVRLRKKGPVCHRDSRCREVEVQP